MSEQPPSTPPETNVGPWAATMAGSPSDEAPPPVSAEQAKAFIARQLDPQIEWFERKAKRAKNLYVGLASLQLFATSSIPVLNATINSATASTTLAAVAAVATGLVAIGKHQEHWVNYRRTADALRAIKLNHDLRLEPFNGIDADLLMIKSVNALLHDERDNWADVHQTPKAKKLGAGQF